MKKFILIAAAFLGVNSFAQSDKQITKITDATCECLNEKDIEAGDMSRLEVELGVCMLGAMSEEDIPFDLDDLGSIEDLGERVGMKLALSCPKFLDIIGDMAEEDPEGFYELLEDDVIALESASGRVSSIESGDFVTIKVERESGRKETFYWMEYFDGANLLEKGGKSVIGKKVLIKYESIEVYSPKMEDYSTIKVLRSLSVK